MSDDELRRQIEKHAAEMVGEAFRQARAAEGLLPAQLAASAGVPIETILAIERGDDPLPDQATMRRLFGALPTLFEQVIRLARRPRQ